MCVYVAVVVVVIFCFGRQSAGVVSRSTPSGPTWADLASSQSGGPHASEPAGRPCELRCKVRAYGRNPSGPISGSGLATCGPHWVWLGSTRLPPPSRCPLDGSVGRAPTSGGRPRLQKCAVSVVAVVVSILLRKLGRRRARAVCAWTIRQARPGARGPVAVPGEASSVSGPSLSRFAHTTGGLACEGVSTAALTASNVLLWR